ncbi:MAG TPA: cation transporting ATPase C-terminal domain-containing protein, partial [Solirubrobacter sp.]
LLESVTLEADESALTGERVPAAKGIDLVMDEDASLPERTDMLYLGTRVTRGSAEVVVTATGLATEAGRISALLTEPEPATAAVTDGPPWLLRRLLPLAGAALVLTTGIGLLRGDAADGIALAAIALTVGALPVCLPAVVTAILGRGTRALERAGESVQRPAALEALGSVSALNFGASGLLTSEALTAVELVLTGRRYAVSGAGYSLAGTIKRVAGDPVVTLDPFLLGLALTSDAVVTEGALTGDPVQGALVVLAEKGGLDVAVTRARWPRVAEAPYDATHGLMATFHRMAGESGTDVVRCFARGAPDSLLSRSVTELGADLRPLRMDARTRERYLAESARLAGRGLRVVAFARRDFPADGFQVPAGVLTLVDGLTLLALVGIADPPRAGAKAAVASCTAAGVRVRLVTGRPAPGAEVLAGAVGIEGRTITGTELAAMSDRGLAGELDGIGVVADATPEQRVRLVAGLRRQGEVVAVAGRGLGDAPAVRAAAVGMAEDHDVADVSRTAASLTVGRDVAAWTAAAIGTGRGAHDDVARYARFHLGVLSGVILTFAGASVFAVAGGMPFLPIQAFYVAFTAQLAAGLVAGNRGHGHSSGPRPRIPWPPQGRRVALVATLQAAATLGVIAIAEHSWDTPVARTMGLVTLAFTTVALAFAGRAGRSPLLAAAVAIGAIVLGVEARLLQLILETEGLSAAQWAICAGASLPFVVLAFLDRDAYSLGAPRAADDPQSVP